MDRLAPGRVHAVRDCFRRWIPVSHAIANVPVDDEALTAEEAQALDEARAWLKHNKPILHGQVLAELGISQEEIENYGNRS